MRIVTGTDEKTEAPIELADRLRSAGHEVVEAAMGDSWPEVGRTVGESVARGDAELGIAWCWTGTGVSIAANKVPGVRAALCGDVETAAGARRWNDANVLAFSLRLTDADSAMAMVEAFLAAEVDETERANIESTG